MSSRFLFIVDVAIVRKATAAAAASMFGVHTWHFSQIYGEEIKMKGSECPVCLSDYLPVCVVGRKSQI